MYLSHPDTQVTPFLGHDPIWKFQTPKCGWRGGLSSWETAAASKETDQNSRSDLFYCPFLGKNHQ